MSIDGMDQNHITTISSKSRTMRQQAFPKSAIALLIAILSCVSAAGAEEGLTKEQTERNKRIELLERQAKDVTQKERTEKNQLLTLRNQGRFHDAIPLAENRLNEIESLHNAIESQPGVGKMPPSLFWDLPVVDAFKDLALLYYAVDEYAKAVSLLERVQQIEEANGTPLRENSLMDAIVPVVVQEIDPLPERQLNSDIHVSLSLTVPDSHAKALGLNSVLRYKGGRLSTRARILRGSTPDSDRALIAEHTQELSAMLFRGPDDSPMGKYNFVSRIGLPMLLLPQLRRLDFENITSNGVDKKTGIIRFPGDSESVRKNLPSNGALVEWVRYRPFNPKANDETAKLGAPHYAAYVLKPTGDVEAFDLGAVQPIDALVKQFREVLHPNNSSYKDVTRKLFDSLVAPLTIHLAQSKQLFLSPDGPLCLIPFAALLNDDGRPLVERYEISYLTSGSDLIHMNDKSIPRDKPVVLANPNYGQSASSTVPSARGLKAPVPSWRKTASFTFSPLDGVAAEGYAVGSRLGLDDTHVLTGSKATETRLMGLHGPKILHIATHGFFFSQEEILERSIIYSGTDFPGIPLPMFAANPMLHSGLALAGANVKDFTSKDDGILTAAEIANLDLSGTQLVVLSACDTGVGQIKQGDGVYGFRRALMAAGAETQVVSLWKINDEATKSWMEGYYERLLQGQGRSEALRSVQLEMMATPEYGHPFFWAAFISIGDWKPLY